MEFLRARYTEVRERESRKRRSIPSVFDGHRVEITYSPDDGDAVFVDDHPYPADKYWAIATEPAADPDVLADLDAKQRLIDWNEWPGGGSDSRDAYEWALSVLALPFAAHPDFEERRKP